MIEITFRTNLDDYSSSHFNNKVLAVPREGEYVEVLPSMASHFRSKRLPTRLIVKCVTHTTDNSGIYTPNSKIPKIVVELWYSDNDYKLFFPNGLENRN